MRGRPRKYDFASLQAGDRMFVALNGRTPHAAQLSLYNAAVYYAREVDATFRFTTDRVSIAGFVVLERLGPDGKAARLVHDDQARLRAWQTIAAFRPLTANEDQNVKRAWRRIEMRSGLGIAA